MTGNITELIQAQMGQYGSEVFADTSAHTGKWWKIQALSNAAFTTLTGNTTAALGSQTLTAPYSIVGNFTAITLSSGAVIAYKTGD